VDDHYAKAPSRTDYLVHAWRHDAYTLRRQAARVSVPHIADDDGCLSHFPALRAFGNTALILAGRLVATPAGLQAESAGDPGTTGRRGFTARLWRLGGGRRQCSGQYPEKRSSPHEPPCVLSHYHFRRRTARRVNRFIAACKTLCANARGPG